MNQLVFLQKSFFVFKFVQFTGICVFSFVCYAQVFFHFLRFSYFRQNFVLRSWILWGIIAPSVPTGGIP